MIRPERVAELLVLRAATLKEQKQPFTREASMAKLLASEMAMKVTTDCVQLLGGYGYTNDFPVERMMRFTKAGRLAPIGANVTEFVAPL